jgi:hypothetical protein
MFNVPEVYRATFSPGHPMASTPKDGNNGVFIFPYKSRQVYCVASDGAGWEHVSVTVRAGQRSKAVLRMPKWEEMCLVKDLFWEEEDTVLQYHPPKSAYVNCHPTCLHLWRPIGVEVPVPNPLLVGPNT